MLKNCNKKKEAVLSIEKPQQLPRKETFGSMYYELIIPLERHKILTSHILSFLNIQKFLK